MTSNQDGGGIIVDPFAGSGSVGIAAMYAGRPFILYELNEGYYIIAKARLAHAEKQLKLGKRVNDIEAMKPPTKEVKKQRGLFNEKGELW